MLIVGINGQHETDPDKSGTVNMLFESLEAAKTEGRYHGIEDVRTEVVHLGAIGMELHPGTLDYPMRPWIEPVFSLIKSADGLIFASPIQGYTMSDLTNCFINWLWSLEHADTSHDLRGKLLAIMAHGHEDSGMKTCLDILASLNGFGMKLVPNGLFFRLRLVMDRSEQFWQLTDNHLAAQNMVRQYLERGHTIDDNSWLLRGNPLDRAV